MFDALNLTSLRVPPDQKDWPPSATHVCTKFGQKVLWCPVTEMPTDFQDDDGVDAIESAGGHHLSEEQLEPYRMVGDRELDDILRIMEAKGKPVRPGDDVVGLAERAAAATAAAATSAEAPPPCPTQRRLARWIESHSVLPRWADRDQLARGQEVFLAYAPALGYALYYRCLVPGFSIPKIAAVIRRTGYLAPPSRPQEVAARLVDTGAMISACVGFGVEELLPGGRGWRSALHVRVLHAKVRRALLKPRQGGRAQCGDNAWDSSSLGVPINQEDMAATLLAFSINALWGVELIAGVAVSRQEMLDYLALWRYIGWLLGVETTDAPCIGHQSEYPAEVDDLPNRARNESPWKCHRRHLPPLDPCGRGFSCRKNNTSCCEGGSNGDSDVCCDPIRHAQAMLWSIVFHLLEPDATSVEVAHHLLKFRPPRRKRGKKDRGRRIRQRISDESWFYYRASMCRRFVGDPLADSLRLPRHHPRLFPRICVLVVSTLVLVLMRAYTLAARTCPPLRRRIVSFHRERMRGFHNGWEARHLSRMMRMLGRGADDRRSRVMRDCGDNDDDVERPGVPGGEGEGATEAEAASAFGSVSETRDAPCCPFAMVATPTEFAVSCASAALDLTEASPNHSSGNSAGYLPCQVSLSLQFLRFKLSPTIRWAIASLLLHTMPQRDPGQVLYFFVLFLLLIQ